MVQISWQQIADPKKDFVVCTEACNQGLGEVLMQDNHVLCYESRKLKEHEKNYATHDFRLAAFSSPRMEMGSYLHGFYYMIFNESETT